MYFIHPYNLFMQLTMYSYILTTTLCFSNTSIPYILGISDRESSDMILSSS